MAELSELGAGGPNVLNYLLAEEEYEGEEDDIFPNNMAAAI